jgi:NADH:ubiquinone oxidoreductase subunit 6 (subunit J)
MTSFEFLFFITSSIILTSAIVVVSAKNPIHSLLLMILVFINVVYGLFCLEVEFLALSFVIVYIGAVAVLFLFVVMMLNIKIIELNNELIHYFPIGSLIGLIFFFNIFLMLLKSNLIPLLNINFFDQFYLINWFNIIENTSNLEVIGSLLYTYYFYFFMVSAVILLVAMVGAIVLTAQNKDVTIYTQDIFHQLSRSTNKAFFMIS